MTAKSDQTIIQNYLNLLDKQREETFDTLDNLTADQLWQRPAPKAWCIGEILDHNLRLFQSVFPFARFAWRYFRWTGKLLRNRTYKTDIEDPYRKKNFPMWAGFLWSPKFTPDNPVPLDRLISELREEHARVCQFYTGKDEAMLGNIFVFDPLFGFLNLIVTLRIGIYHDQLHYNDVLALANNFKSPSPQDTSQPL